MYSVITAVPMHLSRFFQLKPIVGWVFRGAKSLIPYIPYRSLLLSTTVLNDTWYMYIIHHLKTLKLPTKLNVVNDAKQLSKCKTNFSVTLLKVNLPNTNIVMPSH